MTDGLRTFRDAVAIISGGASGIGKGIGAALARRGARVILADLQTELAEQAAEEMRSDGGTVTATTLDVTDFAATDQLVQQTIGEHGRLDYMFNNAGISIGGVVRLYQIDDWYRVLDVNLRGIVNGVQAAYPVMCNQGFGHIVNTSSITGLTASPSIVAYGASKHAVVGLSTSLRIEAETAGVRVSVLCPGAIQTAMLGGGGKFGKSLTQDTNQARRNTSDDYTGMDPDDFAEQALRQIAANKPIIVLPRVWKLFWWAYRLSPRLGLYLSRTSFLDSMRKQQNRAQPEPKDPTDPRH
jgi:NAD(P)-dependent dehydrogenase (short-subunit alcohol dehydrogenase family)